MAGPCGIRLNHVDYRYDDAEREILKDLDFDFYPALVQLFLVRQVLERQRLYVCSLP